MEKIVKKIRKLIDFQNGANRIDSPEEAANAAVKVQSLLLKYNLSIEDIGKVKEKNKVTKREYRDITNKKNEGNWVFDLYIVLCEFNLGQLIITSRFKGYNKGKPVYVKYGVIIAEIQNIEIIKFLGEQLESRIRVMAKLKWVEIKKEIPEKKNTFIRGYYRGIVIGIRNQLKIQRDNEIKENIKITDLVINHQSFIDKFIDNEYGDLGSSRQSNLSGLAGYHMGKEDGENLSINKGIRFSDKDKKIKD